MKFTEIYNNDKLNVSFEIFPPKGENKEKKDAELTLELEKLKTIKPKLVSVTYGAGGLNKEGSFELVKKVLDMEYNVMPHFTCVCTSKEDIKKYLNKIINLKIDNILALKGDKPLDIDVCYRDFTFAWQLIEYIKSNTDIQIAAAGYPEKHPKAEDMHSDIDNLKRKIEKGAKVIYTQAFFINDNFKRFLELCEKNNIDVPIIPGILPVINSTNLDRMVNLCDIKLTPKIKNYFEKYKNSKEDTIKAGIEFASKQCAELIEIGVKGIHFYTLNKAKSTLSILSNLSYKP